MSGRRERPAADGGDVQLEANGESMTIGETVSSEAREPLGSKGAGGDDR